LYRKDYKDIMPT